MLRVAVRPLLPYVTTKGYVPVGVSLSTVQVSGEMALFMHETPPVAGAAKFGVQVEETVRSTVVPFEDPCAIKVSSVPAVVLNVSAVLPLEQAPVAPNDPSHTWKLVTLVRSTVACVVPVMAPEDAVMVAVP